MPTTHHGPRKQILAALTCPLCPARLAPADRTLRCANRHTFDIARHGYISLMTGHRRPASADTPAMVRARTAFLQAGHYAPLARTVADLATALCPSASTVLDAGVGTGYHLAAVLNALPAAAGLGLDTSTHALRAAARAHPHADAASWDVWQPLPVRTGSIDLVLNVFAPRNGREFHRVLQPDGTLLVVTPTPRHLSELQHHIGLLSIDPDKGQRLLSTLSAHFRREHTELKEYVITLTAHDVYNLASMGPAAHHITPDELHRRIACLDTPLQVTASFLASLYRPR